MKRIGLFLITNLAVMLVLSIVLSLLGVDGHSTSGLLIIAAVFGFGGSLISLALSKKMALRSTGAQIIEQPRNEAERWLLDTVQRQAKSRMDHYGSLLFAQPIAISLSPLPPTFQSDRKSNPDKDRN